MSARKDDTDKVDNTVYVTLALPPHEFSELQAKVAEVGIPRNRWLRNVIAKATGRDGTT